MIVYLRKAHSGPSELGQLERTGGGTDGRERMMRHVPTRLLKYCSFKSPVKPFESWYVLEGFADLFERGRDPISQFPADRTAYIQHLRFLLLAW